MNEGDVFNRNLVIKDIQILTDMFADKGYAFVTLILLLLSF
jgi:outer membrane protein assembly factor BamA